LGNKLDSFPPNSRQLQGDWERLYTSADDGLSFNRICHHILGYGGPTVILIRDVKGHVSGFYTNEAWKESNSFYGSSDCFLFKCVEEGRGWLCACMDLLMGWWAAGHSRWSLV
jgi:hypothetical protein